MTREKSLSKSKITTNFLVGGDCNSRIVVPWLDEDDYDGETAQLFRTVDQGWSFQFPGWQWVVNQINAEYGNARTAAACRSKWMRRVQKQFIQQNLGS